jgi:hypothetical protein
MADRQVTKAENISVIVPVFNSEKYLGEALESVLAQAEKILEILVVDDGSTDRSAEVARSFPKVRLLRQENSGPASARNRGIAEAKGRWLAFIDGDDLWAPTAIDRLLRPFESDPGTEMTIGRMRAVSEKVRREDGELEFLGPASSNFGFGVSLIRREVFERVGPIDSSYQRGEDTEWCARARENGVRIQLIEDVVLYNRRHTLNMTRQPQPSLTLKIVKQSLDRRRKEAGGSAIPLSRLHRPAIQSTTPQEYFSAIESLFEQACQNGGGRSRRFHIGGRSLLLRFASSTLMEKMAPALAHLEVENAGSSDGEILVWDSSSTGVPMLPPAWKFDNYLGKGEVKAFSDERFFTAFQHGPDALNLWDNLRKKGIFWVRDGNTLPFYESSAPLRYLLQFWALAGGQQLIHAAAIGHPEGALLLTGKGGLGKSTTAVSALFSPLRFAGDDYVLLDCSGPPTAYSLYATAKLNDDSLRWFPALQPWVVNKERNAGEKSFALLGPAFRENLISRLPLKAIAIPSVGGAKASFEPISPIECLKALAPSTLVQLPAAGVAAFQGLCSAVRALPCYRFHLGPDPKRLPETMEKLLA